MNTITFLLCLTGALGAAILISVAGIIFLSLMFQYKNEVKRIEEEREVRRDFRSAR